MSGMREIQGYRPTTEGRRRRWFLGARLELIVWYDQAGQTESFQLCYHKPLGKQVITWAPPGRHCRREHSLTGARERTCSR